MSRNSQEQVAGGGSTQYQAAGDVHVHHGMTEERVRELVTAEARSVAREYADESIAIAEARIEKLNEEMVARLSATDNLGALADPAVQVTVRKAQIGAASTERDADYELLGSLVEQRCKSGQLRSTRAAINRAVEVVAELDSEALAGLRLCAAALSYIPIAGQPSQGLDIMNDLLGLVMGEDDLPSGTAWLDHLDLLGAIRINSLGSVRDISDVMSNKLSGYVSVGVESDSDTARQGYERLAVLNVRITPHAHELRAGFDRLPFRSREDMTEILRGIANLDAVMTVADDIFQIDVPAADAREALMIAARQRPHLNKFCTWWESLAQPFSVTAVGTVLGHASVHRRAGYMLPPPPEL